MSRCAGWCNDCQQSCGVMVNAFAKSAYTVAITLGAAMIVAENWPQHAPMAYAFVAIPSLALAFIAAKYPARRKKVDGEVR